MAEFDGKRCIQCGGESFRLILNLENIIFFKYSH